MTSFSEDVGQEIKVRKQIPHPEYNSFTAENDIGLVVLESKIRYTKYASPLSLSPKTVPEGVAAVVSGWGGSPIFPDRLQFLEVETLGNEECFQFFKRNFSEREICATSQKGEARNGDSGGPLVADGLLIGVVSSKVPGGADVYTRVSMFIHWIYFNLL